MQSKILLCCKQDMVQALDSGGRKIFAKQRICGHKPAESSWAAVGVEPCDEHCSSNFQAVGHTGERKGRAREKWSGKEETVEWLKKGMSRTDELVSSSVVVILEEMTAC